MRPQVCEDGLGRAKGKQASSSSPTLNAHGWVKGPRRNNNLEGWHSKVKKIAGKNHLKIFEIVELFRKEQASTEVKLRQLMAGGTRRQAPRQRNQSHCKLASFQAFSSESLGQL